MMYIKKPRQKPHLLQALELLNERMDLPETYTKTLYCLTKKHDYKQLFDSAIEKIVTGDAIILHDLFLSIDNNAFQIDTLIIKASQIYVYEINHYEGDYVYGDGEFQHFPRVWNNIFSELSRTESFLHKLLWRLDLHHPISSQIVFVHPSFVLYEAATDLPFIFPGQIYSYFSHMNKERESLSKELHKLAEKLMTVHQEERILKKDSEDYHLQKLNKKVKIEMTCQCGSLDLHILEKGCFCQKCQLCIPLEEAVSRTFEEFEEIFHNEEIK